MMQRNQKSRFSQRERDFLCYEKSDRMSTWWGCKFMGMFP